MSKGYTMIELLVVMVIVAILAALVTPGIQDTIRRNARESAMLDLLSSLALARSEAVTLSANVSICRSTDQTACAGIEGEDWDASWLVFDDGSAAGVIDGSDSILQIHSALSGQAVITLADGSGADITDEFIQFDDDGFLENSTNGAYFKFCDPDNIVANARAVWISNTGRASMSIDDGDGVHNDLLGNDLVCP